MNLYSNSYIAI